MSVGQQREVFDKKFKMAQTVQQEIKMFVFFLFKKRIQHFDALYKLKIHS